MYVTFFQELKSAGLPVTLLDVTPEAGKGPKVE